MTKTEAPSGRFLDKNDMRLLRLATEVGFIQFHDEPRTLASGMKSRVYVHGRDDATENPEFLKTAVVKILRDTKSIMDEEGDERRPRFIGIPQVANGWTPAITMVDHFLGITGRNTCHAILRSSRKDHGGVPGRWLEGKVNESIFRNILFDNVVTDAGSKKTAADQLVADGFQYAQMDAFVFVDRQQGGLEEMVRLGFRRVHASYLLLDMVWGFGQLGLWTAAAVEKVRLEIEDNQIA